MTNVEEAKRASKSAGQYRRVQLGQGTGTARPTTGRRVCSDVYYGAGAFSCCWIASGKDRLLIQFVAAEGAVFSH